MKSEESDFASRSVIAQTSSISLYRASFLLTCNLQICIKIRTPPVSHYFAESNYASFISSSSWMSAISVLLMSP
ncbi:hypothetical protein Syun_015395 [Stephania yunnanensis]|uniref:Uncharacterized protein n=1 Tax=Stephania yunnanensis TaxID=152371 RepID=A0AAP0JNA9_9MAGN